MEGKTWGTDPPQEMTFHSYLQAESTLALHSFSVYVDYTILQGLLE